MRGAALLGVVVSLLACTAPTAPASVTAPPSPDVADDLMASAAPAPIPVGRDGGGTVPPEPGSQRVRAEHRSLRGVASYYHWRAGEAAAGPRLRKWIGAGWDGRLVTVCSLDRTRTCITVRLTDWCQCFRGTPDERIIDLDDRAFAALGPLSAGLLDVRITR